MMTSHVLLLFGCVLVSSFGSQARVIQQAQVSPPSPEDIRVVHVVFTNHLDVGFDGISPTLGFAFNVMNKYFDVYFPKAIELAEQVRNSTLSFVYTTHPFLVSLYLNCPTSWQLPHYFQNVSTPQSLHCPNATSVESFKQAINRGDIVWHAFPFNAEPEILDAPTFLNGVSMAHQLDDYFGLPHKITMSQRDVPGMTRAVVPLLQSAGIEGITVGVNTASAPPAVPKAFVWEDAKSNTSLLAMWHPHGYGGISVSDCVLVPGSTHALAFAFRSDNAGPPDLAELKLDFALLRLSFPNADIRASTYDSFVQQIQNVTDSLPKVSSEIGDTWIYGIASDPLKSAQTRAVMRAKQECFQRGLCNASDPSLIAFDRLFIKNAEHTWGLDVKQGLADWKNWFNSEFETHRNDNNFLTMVNSWLEQRSFVSNAIALVNDTEFGDLVNERLMELTAAEPDLSGYNKVSPHQLFQIGDLSMGFNASNGAINHLRDNKTELEWANASNLLGLFQYQSYSSDDYLSFLSQYLECPISVCSWAAMDLGDYNLTTPSNYSSIWSGVLQSLYYKNISESSASFLVLLHLKEDLHVSFGAPASIWISINLFSQNKTLQMELQWFNKTATRLPEALWLSFSPSVGEGAQWRVHKISSWIDPCDVVVNGSQHLHAVQDGFTCSSGNGVHGLNVKPLDSPLLSVGVLSAFPVPLGSVGSPDAVHYNLYNNLWGTNYIMWYPFIKEDKDSKFRFLIQLNETKTHTEIRMAESN